MYLPSMEKVVVFKDPLPEFFHGVTETFDMPMKDGDMSMVDLP